MSEHVSPERIKALIHQICEAIDRGDVDVTDPDFERVMFAFAVVASEENLEAEVFMLGARTRNGRAVLAKRAQ